MWRNAWASKEEALRMRITRSTECMNEHAKLLPQIKAGERCFVQNQTGNHPKKWDCTGTVIEQGQHNQYLIKIDGSGRLTKRNRQFIRTFKPTSATIEAAPRVSDHKSKESNTGIDQPIIPPLEEPIENTNVEPTDREVSDPSPTASYGSLEPPQEQQKVPAMLKRLLPHNSAGEKESIVAPELGGRRSRRLCNL